jgi:hypothetical protein
MSAINAKNRSERRGDRADAVLPWSYFRHYRRRGIQILPPRFYRGSEHRYRGNEASAADRPADPLLDARRAEQSRQFAVGSTRESPKDGADHQYDDENVSNEHNTCAYFFTR